MGNFDRKYTDDQRDAMAAAYEDRRIRPARLVVELAQRGALEWRGQALDPFQTNDNTVRDCAKDLRRKRQGKRTSQLASLEPRDAIETLRVRLVNAADAMLQAFEKDVRRDAGTADPERLRQIMRCVKEAQAIPGKGEARTPRPGQKAPGTHDRPTGGATKGGLAGSIINAARGETVRDDPHLAEDEGHSSVEGWGAVAGALKDAAAQVDAQLSTQQHAQPTQPTQPGAQASQQDSVLPALA